jgi:GTP-binding protein
VPNLGMVRMSDDRSFVMADVPGLIEGAHTGAGLGHRFLRHLERTRVLVHLLEVSADPDRTVLGDYRILRKELALFDPGLAERPEIVVLNKSDLPDTARQVTRVRAAFARRKLPFFVISAATGEGVPQLLETVWRTLKAERRPPAKAQPSAG